MPALLKILIDSRDAGPLTFRTAEGLQDRYIEFVAGAKVSVRTESLGTPRWRALRELALYFSENGVTEVALSEVPELQATLKLLVDAGVLVERAGSVRFVHETMYDHVFARAFVDDGRCLIDEVLGGPQDLSGRAFIRRILSFERGVDRVRYENSVRALLQDKRVRFHLRDVVFDVLREDLGAGAIELGPSGRPW